MWRLIDHRYPDVPGAPAWTWPGHPVATNVPCPTPAAVEVRPVAAPDMAPAGHAGPDVSAQLGGRLRRITTVQEAPDTRTFTVDHGLVLRVSADLAEAWPTTPESCADVPEALLGAGLMLLAAGAGWFGLHAAAVADARGVTLLCGPSGQGKSSLARLAARPIHGRFGAVQRCADDIVLLDAQGQFVAPVPQLKLDPMLLPGPEIPAVRRIIWPEFDDGVAAPALVPLPPASVRLRLIRDSVAARLFDARMLAGHLAWVTRISAATPGFVLARPRVDPALVGIANRHALDLLLD